ncbi:MAG: Ig domain-containing protein [Lachnospiraceae bacterium]
MYSDGNKDKTMRLNITGGTIESDKSYAIREMKLGEVSSNLVTEKPITISGGVFKGVDQRNTDQTADNMDSSVILSTQEKFITGGTFIPGVAEKYKAGGASGIIEGVESTKTPSISVSGDTTVKKGKTITLNASVNDGGENPTISWTSSNTEVATVSADADNSTTVTGVAEGTAEITASVTVDGKAYTVTYPITVTNPATSVTLDSPATVVAEQSITLTPTIEPSDTKDAINWYATVDDKNDDANNYITLTPIEGGKKATVTGYRAGTVNVTVKVGDQTATCQVTVTEVMPQTVSFSKSEDETVESDKKITLSLNTTPSDAAGYDVKWSSSNPYIVSVSGQGKTAEVEGWVPGETIVRASLGKWTGTGVNKTFEEICHVEKGLR